MKDFLRGKTGAFLLNLMNYVLTILGVLLLFAGFVLLAINYKVGVIPLVLGIVCFCVIAGIRYWLPGYIFKMNKSNEGKPHQSKKG